MKNNQTMEIQLFMLKGIKQFLKRYVMKQKNLVMPNLSKNQKIRLRLLGVYLKNDAK